jgi:hypothetical protein
MQEEIILGTNVRTRVTPLPSKGLSLLSHITLGGAGGVSYLRASDRHANYVPSWFALPLAVQSFSRRCARLNRTINACCLW